MTSEEIALLTKRLGELPQDMKLFLRRMKILSRRGQLPRPNYYSSKPCECCGSYHGRCYLKIQYWNVMEELEYYPEDISDFECDGCKKFKEDKMRIENNTAPYIFIFKGQNPKIDCPHFRACRFCQGTGVYSNQLLEVLGLIYLNVCETSEDQYDYREINNAVVYYWHRLTDKDDQLRCEYDVYLSDYSSLCPFCHGTGHLADPIETLLVANFKDNLIEYGLFESANEDLAALRVWQNMKYTKRYFSTDFRLFEKLEADE